MRQLTNIDFVAEGGGMYRRVNAIVMWVKRLLFCPDYKFNFVDGELTSRECKICGKKEHPIYTAKGHIVW